MLSILQFGAMADGGALGLDSIPQAPQVRCGWGPHGFGEGGEHLHHGRCKIKSFQIEHMTSATLFTWDLGALPADAACEIDVLGEDRHPLGMNGNEVGVLKETNEVSFASLLQRQDGGRLEAKLRLEYECNLAHEALEREPTHQESNYKISTEIKMNGNYLRRRSSVPF